MKIIDLSLELYSGLPVYPGDPEVSIEKISTVEKDEWEMRRLEINSHDGTHVNVPCHCVIGWKNLEDYSLDDFMWESVLFESEDDIQKWIGLIFWKKDINWDIAKQIVEIKPKFIGVSEEFDIEIEKYLLEKGIISFERLTNIESLPKKFYFHWAPLRIREWDWSPVRAYVIVN